MDNVRLPRAQQLFNAGFVSIELIAKANAKGMAEKINNMPVPAAIKLIKSAKVIYLFTLFVFFNTFNTILSGGLNFYSKF